MKFAYLASAILALLLSSCADFSLFQGSSSPVGPRFHEEVLKQQIFLDSKNFGPGVIDGRVGEFTKKAMMNYRHANGLRSDWMPDTSNITPYATYRVTAKDLSVLGHNAKEPEDQAKQKSMPYTTLIELLSERFHTTQNFLRTLNRNVDFTSASAGTGIIVPNVARSFRYHDYPASYRAASATAAKNRHVTVDVREKILRIHENGKLIAVFPITPGSDEHPAPAGEWHIVNSVPFPWYRYDLGVLKRGQRTDDFYNLPPGPNSPVGIVWAGLNRSGIGIHGTPAPDTIGRSGSHGCIRLSNWDAANFHTLVGKGTKVTIR